MFVDYLQCSSFQEIHKQLFAGLSRLKSLFPQDRSSRILLKPNLNSNMNALTGNTTDLRIMAALILFLKEQGYTSITIAEGTNSGFYRTGISVISRLKVDELAKYYGVHCIDLNQSKPVFIQFENGLSAGVAKECMEADFFINLPKLKTHFEAGMSVCLKNLIGCLVGQENKKKTHDSLAANIVHLTENINPHLHVIDAIWAMEGLGPTKGTPVKTNCVILGDDPYLLDLYAAKFAGVQHHTIAPLVVAEKKGFLTKRHHEFLHSKPPAPEVKPFAPPKAGPIAEFIHHPKRQKFFLAIRNTRFFNALCNTGLVGHLLYLTNLRQDVFINEEMKLNALIFHPEKCSFCGRCQEYCPVGLTLPESFANKKMKHCIQCLYCFCICPEKAIELDGELGYFEEQIKQYDEILRNTGNIK
ncbi:MAG: [Fe-S]-binding protein [Desulfobulbus propionicus]|nr:MAG: [Fe-S]-binding protein [Desulfobulbus propionicus]